jgi:hypothetical protein
MQTAKERAIEVINSLPDDCTAEDISYRLYLWRKMERSAKDIEEGRIYSKEQAQGIVRTWFTSSGPTKPSTT